MSYPVSFPASDPLVTVIYRMCTTPYRIPARQRNSLIHVLLASATVWVIEMHNGADNRLTEHFLTQALKPALDTVERHWRENWRAAVANKDEKLAQGAVILIGNTKQDKFFSNGAPCLLIVLFRWSGLLGPLWDG